MLSGRTLFAGTGEGPSVALQAPISFWGGIDRRSGEVVGASHPDRGLLIGGLVLYIPALAGSSSSSAVLLELIAGGVAPAAILLGEVDAILVMGCLAAREIGERAPPVVVLPQPPPVAPRVVLKVVAPKAGEPAEIRPV